jgi:hypothetical protein
MFSSFARQDTAQQFATHQPTQRRLLKQDPKQSLAVANRSATKHHIIVKHRPRSAPRVNARQTVPQTNPVLEYFLPLLKFPTNLHSSVLSLDFKASASPTTAGPGLTKCQQIPPPSWHSGPRSTPRKGRLYESKL